MPDREHIDDLLREWAFDPDSVSVRIREGDDGRDVIQMRVDMGILQLETEDRPDGTQPHGSKSYFDYLVSQKSAEGSDFVLDEDQCAEADREFVQFYHRRICWLALREYRNAVKDADHTLGLMDFCTEQAPDEQWAMSHEQYRPFVVFHRAQAAALAELEDNMDAETAIEEIDKGLERLRGLFVQYEAEELFDEDELVSRLNEFRDMLREQYDVDKTLHEQLADAIAKEQYELAAKIRDELAQKDLGPG